MPIDYPEFQIEEGILDTRLLGASVQMVSVESMALKWAVSCQRLRSALRAFEIPMVKFPKGVVMFNLYWFERSMFAATSPHNGDFNFGDSPPKEHCRDKWFKEAWEHSLAATIYMGATKEKLRERMREIGKVWATLAKKRRRKEVKA